MGGSPSMPAPQPLPPAPQPIDYDRMANASIRVAKAQSAEQEASIKRLYPEYTKLQFQTADQLAGKLNNEYLARTRGVVGEELLRRRHQPGSNRNCSGGRRTTFAVDLPPSKASLSAMRGVTWL
jgi:hypothetical protein